MNWINLIFVAIFAWQAQAQASVFDSVEAQAICTRQKVGRGVGKVLVSLCKPDEMLIGALCYPICKDGNVPYGTNLCIVIGCGGRLIYPTCRSGYYGITANICSPVCPNGWTDGCPAGMENDAGLCYPPCPKEFNGAGPVCWKKFFDETPWPCGVFCTQSEQKCSRYTIKIVEGTMEAASKVATKDAKGTVEAIQDTLKNILEPPKCP